MYRASVDGSDSNLRSSKNGFNSHQKHKNNMVGSFMPLNNEDVLNELDSDPTSVKKALFEYVTRRLEEFDIPMINIDVRFTKIAHIITFTLRGLLSGKSVGVTHDWTDMEFLAYNTPFRYLIDSVIRKVSEVPLDGIPAS